MRVITLTFALIAVLALVTPLVPAATRGLDAPLVGVRIVEGHTTFAVLGDAAILGGPVAPRTAGAPLKTAASSTLSPEPTGPLALHKYFPGVRWTNDQFLVDPVNNEMAGPGPTRVDAQFAAAVAILVGDAGALPCSGAVLLTPSGAADPRGELADLRCQGSAVVTDPNDVAWTTDAWGAPDGSPVWSVAVRCGAVTDAALARGATYPGRDGPVPQGFRYDALAFLALDQGVLAPTGTVGHAASTDGALDGNSHPFDPYAGVPGRIAYEPHGTSDASATPDRHATFALDAYYASAIPTPLQRHARIVDTEGSTAPFG